MKMWVSENFKLCRKRSRKLSISLIGQFHLMTEPTSESVAGREP